MSWELWELQKQLYLKSLTKSATLTQNLPMCIEEVLLQSHSSIFWNQSSTYHNCKIQLCRWWATSLVHTSPEQPLKYQNGKSQGINNRHYPFLDNLQDITFEIFSEFLWATMVVLCSLWATRTVLFKGWTTTMFIVLCEQPPIFSLKFFSKLEMC